MKNINPGELKHRIGIQRNSISKDDDNIAKEVPEITNSVRAKIINLKATDSTKGSGTIINISKKFIIRYSKCLDILYSDKVIYNNKKYNIVFINNIDDANRYIEIVGELIE